MPHVDPKPEPSPNTSHLPTAGVPVFNCIVYIKPGPGGVRARVANLPGLECIAANERAALSKIIPAFKQRVSELLRNGLAIPWIEPPSPVEPDEQARFIPVHL